MEHFVEDRHKRRLTERVDILTAIEVLRQQGYDHDELVKAMTRIFYVDLDAYNEALSTAA